MDNFDSYNVLLAIATNISYDCFCAPGSHISFYFIKLYLFGSVDFG